MLWIMTWCDYGIGAILALIATGNLTPWWFLATPALPSWADACAAPRR